MPVDVPQNNDAEERLRAERAIAAAYRAILLRDPDPGGLAAWIEELVSGRVDLQALLQSLLHSDEFAGRAPEFLSRYLGPHRLKLTNDVSQYGEFWLMLREMVNSAARHRIVVDIGARGRERSNSYDLLRHFGWRGVLIEANPALIDNINREFGGLDFALVNTAVSNYAGEATFYIGVNDDVSSLNQSAAASWGDIRNQVTVKVERISTILQAYDVPQDFDLLSIDAEGEDVNILNDCIGSDYLPHWVIIEASHDFQTRTLADLPLTPAVSERYRIAAQTSANLILRRRDA